MKYKKDDDELIKAKKVTPKRNHPKKSTKQAHMKLKKKKKHPFFKKIIFLLIISFFFVLVFLSYRFYRFQKLAKDMFNNTPSIIYDSSGNEIGQIGAERIRENATLKEFPSNLINAYISIEDQRFYSHHGVDIKRTGAAIISYILKRGSSSFGGSTITQQLVKNLTGDNSNSIKRKVTEWFYAFNLEFFFSKEDLLNAYFNIIYTGPNIYGVKTASIYYFNKNVSDLSLAECAFLAGLTNSPNSYNPYSEKDNSTKISSRTKVVLKKMLELNYISEEEYNLALADVNNGLKFKKGKFTKQNQSITSYHTDALINEIINDFMKKENISHDFATNYFYLSGSTVYSTVNKDIQNILEKESKNSNYILKSSNSTDTSQAAIVVIDNETGFVAGCVGGLGEKNKSRTFNRATQMKRQTGSSMKPVAVLLPALDKKIITTVSLIDDSPTTFTDLQNHLYSPINYDGYKGTITLRQAVESSQNIPFVKIMEQLTPQTSISYLKKMGITSLNKNDVNLSLALGGLDEGISPLEFAGAYATIANDRSI